MGESGAIQSVELNQEQPTPIVVTGWSKCRDVTGAADGHYALYLDIVYRDGTN